MPYRIIELDQGTEAWLEWRHGGIGASDAPTVMGENPWKSPEQLFREKSVPLRKMGVAHGRNAAMSRGVELEPEARRRYSAMVGKIVTPICIQSNQDVWLRASLDGLSEDRGLAVEIKCGQSVHRQASLSRKVPGYYYGQLQHIMAITGHPAIHFWCHWPGRDDVLLTVEADQPYIRRMLEIEADFWERVQGMLTGE